MAHTAQRRRTRRAEDEVRRRAPRGEEVEDSERDEELDDQDQDDQLDDGGSSGGVFAELKNVASDAALAVLAPVAKTAATKAAKYAVKKGPELIEDTVMPMLEESGGAKGLVGKVMSSDGAGGLLSKLSPGGEDGGGDAGDGTGQGRRMPVQQAVDVAAPIDVVYDQWTQFEDYPKFTHRVQSVEQEDDAHVKFHAKVWGINRTWEAEIVEQRPDERIAFKSLNGLQLSGVVTFHDLAERLTRIELNVDVDPDGPIEKIARGARFVKRAARSDLKRFKAYVEMHEDATGEWRGEIDDGEVVAEPDEYEDEYYEDEDEPEAEYDEEEYEDADDERDEEDEEEKPARKPARSSARSRSGSSSSSRSRSRSSSGGSSRSRGTKSSKSTSKSSKSTSKSKSSGGTRRSSRKSSSNGGDPKPKSSSSRRRGSSSKGGSRSKASSRRSS